MGGDSVQGKLIPGPAAHTRPPASCPLTPAHSLTPAAPVHTGPARCSLCLQRKLDTLHSYFKPGFISAALDLTAAADGDDDSTSCSSDGGQDSDAPGSEQADDQSSSSAGASGGGAAISFSSDVSFDKSSLAYTILRGSMAARYKSMRSYSQIYQGALEEYGIHVEMCPQGESGWYEGKGSAVERLAEGARKGVAAVEAQRGEELQDWAAKKGIISAQEFGVLEGKKAGKQGLDIYEKQLWWEHYWAVRCYGVPAEKVDDSFRQRYVKSYVPDSVGRGVESKYLRLRRLWYAHKFDQQQLLDEGRAVTLRIQSGCGDSSVGDPIGDSGGGALGSSGEGSGDKDRASGAASSSKGASSSRSRASKGSGTSGDVSAPGGGKAKGSDAPPKSGGGAPGGSGNTDVTLANTRNNKIFPAASPLQALLDAVTPDWRVKLTQRAAEQLKQPAPGEPASEWTEQTKDIRAAMLRWLGGITDDTYRGMLTAADVKFSKSHAGFAYSRSKLISALTA